MVVKRFFSGTTELADTIKHTGANVSALVH